MDRVSAELAIHFLGRALDGLNMAMKLLDIDDGSRLGEAKRIIMEVRGELAHG